MDYKDPHEQDPEAVRAWLHCYTIVGLKTWERVSSPLGHTEAHCNQKLNWPTHQFRKAGLKPLGMGENTGVCGKGCLHVSPNIWKKFIGCFLSSSGNMEVQKREASVGEVGRLVAQ